MQERSFLSSGLKVGSIKGIEVRVHWTLLLLLFYHFHGEWTDVEYGSVKAWGLWSAALFLSILLHEFGHCYAAYRMRGGADMIILWPLGGLARCDAPNTPRAQFWVAAGGPIVTLAIVVFLYILHALPAFRSNFSFLVVGSVKGMYDTNLFLLIFNLLPIYPLDGGRIFQCIVWSRIGSYGRATLITIWTSRFAIVAAIILSFFPPFNDYMGPWAILIAVWALFQTEKLRQRLHETEDDSVFGYDFSRGYTSLEGTTGTTKKQRAPSFFERRKLKREARRREYIAELRKQVDALLAKISEEGMQSLNRKERRFLEQASKELKEE